MGLAGSVWQLRAWTGRPGGRRLARSYALNQFVCFGGGSGIFFFFFFLFIFVLVP